MQETWVRSLGQDDPLVKIPENLAIVSSDMELVLPSQLLEDGLSGGKWPGAAALHGSSLGPLLGTGVLQSSCLWTWSCALSSTSRGRVGGM